MSWLSATFGITSSTFPRTTGHGALVSMLKKRLQSRHLKTVALSVGFLLLLSGCLSKDCSTSNPTSRAFSPGADIQDQPDPDTTKFRTASELFQETQCPTTTPYSSIFDKASQIHDSMERYTWPDSPTGCTRATDSQTHTLMDQLPHSRHCSPSSTQRLVQMEGKFGSSFSRSVSCQRQRRLGRVSILRTRQRTIE